MTRLEADTVLKSGKPFILNAGGYGYDYILWRKGDIVYSYDENCDAWDELLVLPPEEIDSMIDSWCDSYIMVDYFEDEDLKQNFGNTCVCPADNFRLNGIGCVCGGK